MADNPALENNTELDQSTSPGDPRDRVGSLLVAARQAVRLHESQRAYDAAAEAVKMAQTVGDRLLVGSALIEVGHACLLLGDRDRARECFANSLRIGQMQSSGALTAAALIGQSKLAIEDSQINHAMELLQQATDHATETGDQAAIARAQNELGDLKLRDRRLEGAQWHYEAARAAATQASATPELARALTGMAVSTLELKRVKESVPIFREALEYIQAAEDLDLETTILEKMRPAFTGAGLITELVDLLTDHFNHAHESADLQREYRLRSALAGAYHLAEMYDGAIFEYEKAAECARELEDRHLEAQALAGIADAYEASSFARMAIDIYRQLIDLARVIEDRALELKGHAGLGVAHESAGHVDEAVESLRQAVLLTGMMGDRAAEAEYLIQQGAILANTDRRQEALETYQRARSAAERLGNDRLVRQIDDEIARIKPGTSSGTLMGRFK